ncbi:PfkB family carbohydrate kinase [Cellulomonas marina]|uniref:Ribokinase n=1 Tax=Cellulomonas marina TaxID=988821 RepID=A0A1I0V5B3_9CELL|nr:PfkB family carbohydrate kinase [Cellulomonas marina]GIG28300.1 ribokinase [Cellulomonas marina]SFA70746.1 ribokinase [Cellulomonas marina]
MRGAPVDGGGGGVVRVVGSLNEDLTVTTHRAPGPGETVLGRDVARGAGGKGGNQAVAAARAGARTVMVGAVGRDDAGTRLLAGLVDEGVDTSCVQRVGSTTGLALITLDDDGENRIVVVAGANASLGAAHVRASLGALAPGDVVVAQGEVPPAAVEEAGRCAADAGALLVLNLAPVVDVDLAAAAPAVLVLNEREAALLDPSGREAADRAERLCRRTGAAVVVTAGAAGAVVASSGGVRRAAPVPAAQVVDTTGAGDAFVGALAAGLAAGEDLDGAVA